MSQTAEWQEEENWEQVFVWAGKRLIEKYDMFSLYLGMYHFSVFIKV